MKRELPAIILLAAILIVSLLNIRYIDKVSKNLTAYVDSAQEFSVMHDYDSAIAEIEKALDYWSSINWYTHIAIRHSEVDNLNGLFYSLMTELESDEKGSAFYSFEGLKACIYEISDMEHISFKSIL